MNDPNQLNIYKEEVINHNNDIKIDGLEYFPNFISLQEQKDYIEKIDEDEWSLELLRRVQHYGYRYDYSRRRVDNSMRIADPPEWIQKISIQLEKSSVFDEIPDQVIVNEYEPGQGISNHIDCEPCFTNTVASLSLGSQCVVNFTNKNDTEMAVGKVVPFLLEPCSLFVLKNNARYNWMHGIKAVKTDKYFETTIKRKRRISLTFRKVILTD